MPGFRALVDGHKRVRAGDYVRQNARCDAVMADGSLHQLNRDTGALQTA